jgi:hypothetical protein
MAKYITCQFFNRHLLAKHLGGSYLPIGNDFTGSTIKIEIGGELVPGLSH